MHIDSLMYYDMIYCVAFPHYRSAFTENYAKVFKSLFSRFLKKDLIISADTLFSIHRFNFLLCARTRMHARQACAREDPRTHGHPRSSCSTRVVHDTRVRALSRRQRLALGAATTGRWG